MSVFHQLIRDASGNAFISRFVETLVPFERVHRRSISIRRKPNGILHQHQAIAAALIARDADLAERLMAEHFAVAGAYWRSMAEAAPVG